jgi:CcmD family protein
MENRRLKSLYLLLAIASSTASFAGSSNFLDDTFYRDGKYYVAVLIVCIIFAAIIAYLITLDRKIGKLEKEIKNEN